MNRIIKMTLAVLGGVLFASCQPEPEFKFASHGPNVEVVDCPDLAFMGDAVSFEVAVSDADYALSTLKAELLFDGTVMSSCTIRTKTDGTYEGTVEVPFLKDIPDGDATVKFTATNANLGVTEIERTVPVKRPEFAYLTLNAGDKEYKMSPLAGKPHEYAVSGTFPAQCYATITTSPVVDGGKSLSFGWANGAVELGATGEIPFSSNEADYTISFNVLTFEASPFFKLYVNGVEARMVDSENYFAVIDLKKGDELSITGSDFEGYAADADFVKDEDGKYTFLAVEGKYRIGIEMARKYFRIEAMKNQTEYATLNDDGTGAVWLIGEKVGKPSYEGVPGWNPEQGGLCLAQLEPKKHSITLVVGETLKAGGINFKFFHQKSWGGEFGGDTISTESEFVVVGKNDGNIGLAEGLESLEVGAAYRFTVDLTGMSADKKGAVLVVEKL